MLEGSKDQFLWEPEKVKDQSSMERVKQARNTREGFSKMGKNWK